MAVPVAGSAHRILVVDGEAKQLRRLTQVLRTIVDPFAEQELPPNALDGSFDLVVVNYDGLAPDERKRILDGPLPKRPGSLVLVSEGACKHDYVRLFGSHVLTNLVAKNGDVDAEELIVTSQKILRRDVFGLEKYFVWGVEPLTMKVRSSADKERAIHSAEEYVRRIGINPRFAYLFAKVTDEFVTNGIYNAPVDKQGRRRFAAVSRREDISVEPGEEVLVKFCSDGRLLGISVTDPFGSLDPATLLDYLSRCFRKGEDRPLDKPGGAGLGFYYVFESVSQFIVNINRGRQTEMIGLIDIRGSFRDFAEQNKSFNVFTAAGL